MKVPHDSAHTHVTGQSEFIDDRPAMKNELYLELIYSPHPKASIVSIHVKKALEVSGVAGIFTHEDVHTNLWGTIFQDQPLFAKDEVNFAGEVVALIAAESREAARKARALVEVKYKVTPAILTIDQAKTAQSFIGFPRKIERGDVDAVLKNCKNTISGQIVIRGADHFYLESQAAVAYPKEDGQIEVHSSSQHPTETQHVVAHALGVSDKDVVCIVKRMGGAFGGKESQAAPFAAYAALAAHKLKRPARIVLTKDDDMIVTGKRNPFQNHYVVGFDDDGKILALDAQLYSDGGAYADLSTSIMERAMLHIDNAYFIPALRVTGQVCRTHYHPHTAFRGFGGPKGVATIEKIIEEIAHAVGKDPLEIRKINCYRDGFDVTHYGQKVENNCLPRIFSQLEKSSDYHNRRKEIEIKNSERNPELIYGLSLTPVKFGISFTTRFLNQANALVILNRDGTVQVSTGATEMGQGVNVRIAGLVSSELGLNHDQVRMMVTSTERNANTSPTAASSGTDLNGAAALLATRRLKYRLSEIAKQVFLKPKDRWATKTAGLGTEAELPASDRLPTNDPNLDADSIQGIATFHGVAFENGRVFLKSQPDLSMTFSDLVTEAYYNRVSLTEYAYYKFPGIEFNKLSGQGNAFLYYTQGAAVSEVSINVDTGEVKVLRVDILMDLGKCINRGLDIGQITGGFVQGMGWATTEKLFYKNGFLMSHSPSTYKIPSIQDTPRIFNVELLENEGNRVNVRGTKAVGEPPLLLAISVWTAIQNALTYRSVYQDRFPQIELPATNEEIIKALYPKAFTT